MAGVLVLAEPEPLAVLDVVLVLVPEPVLVETASDACTATPDKAMAQTPRTSAVVSTATR